MLRVICTAKTFLVVNVYGRLLTMLPVFFLSFVTHSKCYNFISNKLKYKFIFLNSLCACVLRGSFSQSCIAEAVTEAVSRKGGGGYVIFKTFLEGANIES